MERRNIVGFTLLEILVAIAIMGIALLCIIQLFGGALKNAKMAQDYSTAAILCSEKMEEVLLNPSIEEKEEAGEFDEPYRNFRWTVKISLFNDEEVIDEDSNIRLYKIEVKVFWREKNKEKSFTLTTLRCVKIEKGSLSLSL